MLIKYNTSMNSVSPKYANKELSGMEVVPHPVVSSTATGTDCVKSV